MYKVTITELEMYYKALQKAEHFLKQSNASASSRVEITKALNHIKLNYINNIKNK
jgi:hypothetical protein